MKNLLIAILFVSFSSLSIAQTVSYTPVNEANLFETKEKSTEAKLKEEKAKLEAAIMSQMHTKIAQQQLQKYLAEHLVYTETLKANCIEDNVVLVISLDEKGQVVETAFKDKVHPEVSKQILSAIKEAKNISINNNNYKGQQQIEIPVTFSLR